MDGDVRGLLGTHGEAIREHARSSSSMLCVPEEVLNVNRLSPEQLSQLREHPEHSQRIVRTFGKAFDWIAKVVVQVHERYHGSGHPKGLRREEIHEFPRIIGLVDIYEAMAQPRADRQARVVSQCFEEDHRSAQQPVRSILDQSTHRHRLHLSPG